MKILECLLKRLKVDEKIEVLVQLDLIETIFDYLSFHQRILARHFAIKHNKLDLLRFLQNNNVFEANDTDYLVAVEYKSHDALRLLFEFDRNFNSWMSVIAVQNNDIESIKIMKEYNCDVHEYAFIQSIGMNNKDMFDFLVENFPHVYDSDDCFFALKMVDFPNFLDTLIKDGYKLNKYHLDEACRENKVNVFKYLLEKGVEPDERTMENSVKGNSIECVKTLLDLNCKWDLFSYNASVGLAFPEIINLLEEDAKKRNMILPTPQISSFSLGL